MQAGQLRRSQFPDAAAQIRTLIEGRANRHARDGQFCNGFGPVKIRDGGRDVQGDRVIFLTARAVCGQGRGVDHSIGDDVETVTGRCGCVAVRIIGRCGGNQTGCIDVLVRRRGEGHDRVQILTRGQNDSPCARNRVIGTHRRTEAPCRINAGDNHCQNFVSVAGAKVGNDRNIDRAVFFDAGIIDAAIDFDFRHTNSRVRIDFVIGAGFKLRQAKGQRCRANRANRVRGVERCGVNRALEPEAATATGGRAAGLTGCWFNLRQFLRQLGEVLFGGLVFGFCFDAGKIQQFDSIDHLTIGQRQGGAGFNRAFEAGQNQFRAVSKTEDQVITINAGLHGTRIEAENISLTGLQCDGFGLTGLRHTDGDCGLSGCGQGGG